MKLGMPCYLYIQSICQFCLPDQLPQRTFTALVINLRLVYIVLSKWRTSHFKQERHKVFCRVVTSCNVHWIYWKNWLNAIYYVSESQTAELCMLLGTKRTWDNEIPMSMRSIFRSHIMNLRKPQNAHRLYFWAIWSNIFQNG